MPFLVTQFVCNTQDIESFSRTLIPIIKYKKDQGSKGTVKKETTSEEDSDASSIDADMQGPDFETEEQLYQRIMANNEAQDQV